MVTIGPGPREGAPGEEARTRRAVGCGVILGAVLAGAVLTVAQLSLLHRTWTACELGGPLGDDFPGGAAYTWFLADAVRFAVYGAACLAGAGVSGRWMVRSGLAGAVLRALIVVAFCAVPFAVDFAWGVRMDPGTFDPARCPGGVPEWWPF